MTRRRKDLDNFEDEDDFEKCIELKAIIDEL